MQKNIHKVTNFAYLFGCTMIAVIWEFMKSLSSEFDLFLYKYLWYLQMITAIT